MPTNNCRRLDQNEGTLPATPEPAHQHPKLAICSPELWPSRPALKDGQLLSQHEVLGEELVAAVKG